MFTELGGDQSPILKNILVPEGTIWSTEFESDIGKLKFQKDPLLLLSKTKGKSLLSIYSQLNSMVFQIVGVTTSEVKLAGSEKTEKMNGVELLSFFGKENKVSSKILFASDKISVFILNDATGTEYVTTTRDFWQQVVPSAAVALNKNILDLNPELFRKSGPLFLQLSVSQDLIFPNMAKYWKLISKTSSNSRDGFKFQYDFESQPVLPPNGLPLFIPIQGPVNSSPYLSDSPLVQVSLPALIPLSQNLRQGFRGTKIDMVKKIAALVNQTLSYDDNMVSENLLFIANTETILRLRKGVCQHFANLFAALGRSVGLPTRIVSGYLFGNGKLNRHAWVEVEIMPNNWLPIEPQSSVLNVDFSDYLPLIINKRIETPEIDPTDLKNSLFSATLYFKIQGYKR